MAIKNRRGAYTYFDRTKMVEGEFAFVQTGDPNHSSGRSLHACFSPGTAIEIAQQEDVDHLYINMAFEYDATRTYSVGDYVIHDGLLYICSTDITTPETWMSSHWQTITLSRLVVQRGSGEGSEKFNSASNVASGGYSHAEGMATTASAVGAHAEGAYTTASGGYGHAEGGNTTASGGYSHAQGYHTIANHFAQHSGGQYNVPDDSTADSFAPGKYVEIIGNGTSDSNRSNARTLDWNGNEVLSGKLTIGVAPSADMDVTTKKYVDDAISAAVTYTDANNDGNIVITVGGE